MWIIRYIFIGKSCNYVFVYFQVLEDPLQLKRLQCVIDGYVDEDCTTYEGMLGEPICFYYVDEIKFLQTLLPCWKQIPTLVPLVTSQIHQLDYFTVEYSKYSISQ